MLSRSVTRFISQSYVFACLLIGMSFLLRPRDDDRTRATRPMPRRNQALMSERDPQVRETPADRSRRGRDARGPLQLTWRGWKDIIWRIWYEIGEDRVMLIAAGATFYLLLALFPFLAAFVSLYGFVADPRTIGEHIAFLGGLLPSGGVDLIEAQLKSLVSQDPEIQSFGFFTGLLFALWSANSGVKALFDGLNVVYNESEKRTFFRLNLLSFAFTIGAMLIGMSFIFAVGVIPAMLAYLYLDNWTEILIRLGRWPILLSATAVGLILLYRFGPSRRNAKLRWLTAGTIFASFAWVVTSWGFSFYLQNFADYNATYGSLGAVIGFMIWTWVSVIILLLGAELNAEMEHQTAMDSTIGRPKPMGKRGARMADTLGRSISGD